MPDGDQVLVDLATLNRESLQATKKPGDTILSGSIIGHREIAALVYATGNKTYFGRTVRHSQKAVLCVSNYPAGQFNYGSKRLGDVTGILPNVAAVTQLIGALLLE